MEIKKAGVSGWVTAVLQRGHRRTERQSLGELFAHLKHPSLLLGSRGGGILLCKHQDLVANGSWRVTGGQGKDRKIVAIRAENPIGGDLPGP